MNTGIISQRADGTPLTKAEKEEIARQEESELSSWYQDAATVLATGLPGIGPLVGATKAASGAIDAAPEGFFSRWIPSAGFIILGIVLVILSFLIGYKEVKN